MRLTMHETARGPRLMAARAPTELSGCAGARHRPQRVPRQRRDFIRHQLLNLEQPSNRERMRKLVVRGGGTHAHPFAGPLNDGVLILFLNAPMHDRVVISEFQLTHLTVAIELPTDLELGGREGP